MCSQNDMWLRSGASSTTFAIALIFLDVVLCAGASSLQAPQGCLVQSEKRPTSHERPPAVPSPSLKRRVAFLPYVLTEDWLVDHHDFVCLLPLSTAAAMLQDFYEHLSGFAAVTNRPPSQSYHFRLGTILLEITAPQGTKIGWAFVQTFSMQMLEMTKRGYTNTYQINFVHRATGKLITFSLWIRMT